MYIHITEKPSTEKWNNYVLNQSRGLAYHLTSWQEAIEDVYGFNSYSLIAEDGGKVCGILPLTKLDVPWKKPNLISLPYCDVAGVLANNQAAASALLKHAKELAIDENCNLQIRSADVLSVQDENLTDKVRMILKLPNSTDELLSGLKSKVRSQVKKPLRDGLSVKVGGTDLLDHFFLVFSENMRDLGSPVHSRDWIDAIIRHYGAQALVAVVYTPDQQPAAGGILLEHHTTVSVPWASSLRRFNSLNPNMLLYWTFLSHASDNGHRYFDFGRSTLGEGSYRFKEQWGAVPEQLYWYSWPEKHLGNDKASKIKSNIRKTCENIWSHLPLSMANNLGPAIRKYISL